MQISEGRNSIIYEEEGKFWGLFFDFLSKISENVCVYKKNVVPLHRKMCKKRILERTIR